MINVDDVIFVIGTIIIFYITIIAIDIKLCWFVNNNIIASSFLIGKVPSTNSLSTRIILVLTFFHRILS